MNHLERFRAVAGGRPLGRMPRGEAVARASADGCFRCERAFPGIRRHLEAVHGQAQLLRAANADLAESTAGVGEGPPIGATAPGPADAERGTADGRPGGGETRGALR